MALSFRRIALVIVLLAAANVFAFGQKDSCTAKKGMTDLFAGYAFEPSNTVMQYINVGFYLHDPHKTFLNPSGGLELFFGLGSAKSTYIANFLAGVSFLQASFGDINAFIDTYAGVSFLKFPENNKANTGLTAKLNFNIGYRNYYLFLSTSYMQSGAVSISPNIIGIRIAM